MGSYVHQGDIIRLSEPQIDALVLSKDFFNQMGMAVLCPVKKNEAQTVLHIRITDHDYEGFACLDGLKSMDLRKRYYKTLGSLDFQQIQELSDTVQAIFDCYPYNQPS